MILLGVIHWCISIPLASCSSHPSIFVQSVCHSGKSWRHWLTIINLVFISNVLKTIIIIGIELCLAWNTFGCVWSVTATCISILYDSIWHSFRASTQDCIIQSHYLNTFPLCDLIRRSFFVSFPWFLSTGFPDSVFTSNDLPCSSRKLSLDWIIN